MRGELARPFARTLARRRDTVQSVQLRARWARRSAPPVLRPSDPDPFTSAQTGPRNRAGWAPSGAFFLHVIRYPRARARAASRGRRRGLHRAHPGAARGHPAGPPAPRPARRRPDRHRQDRGLRPPGHPDPARDARRPARAQPAVAAGPPSRPGHRPPARPRPRRRPHPRARDPGRGERPDLRQAPPGPLDHHLRRRRLRAAGLQAACRPGDRRRHARPPARPRQPADHRPLARRDPHPRRGRPPPRHGFHPRHPEDHRPPAAPPAEPAVLGDVLGRRPRARRRACSTSPPASR